MKIDKLIVSVDNSHYKDYWPLIAKVAKKAPIQRLDGGKLD
jgi:hypothetical protein